MRWGRPLNRRTTWIAVAVLAVVSIVAIECVRMTSKQGNDDRGAMVTSAAKYQLSPSEIAVLEKESTSDPGASFRLSQYYANVAQDRQKAWEWMKQAAKDGHAEAMYQLGYMIHNAMGLGANEPFASGMEWISKAAAKGFAPAVAFVERTKPQKTPPPPPK